MRQAGTTELMIRGHRLLIGPVMAFPPKVVQDRWDAIRDVQWLFSSYIIEPNGQEARELSSVLWGGSAWGPLDPNKVTALYCALKRIEMGGVMVLVVSPQPDARRDPSDMMREVAPRSPKGKPAAINVANMDLDDRFLKVLSLTPPFIKNAAAGELDQMFSAQNIAMTAGILALWAASHAVGIGFVVDVGLLGYAIYEVGWLAFGAVEQFIEFVELTVNAASEIDLENAAKILGAALGILGVAVAIRLICKGAKSRRRDHDGGSSRSDSGRSSDGSPGTTSQSGSGNSGSGGSQQRRQQRSDDGDNRNQDKRDQGESKKSDQDNGDQSDSKRSDQDEGGKSDAEKETSSEEPTPVQMSTRDQLEADAGVTRRTKGKTRHGSKSGGMEAADADFDSLDPKEVKTIETKYGPGRTGKLDTGERVTVRPGSSEGPATLEIRRPNGRGVEIRYPDSPPDGGGN